jgi:hypothetical protein
MPRSLNFTCVLNQRSTTAGWQRRAIPALHRFASSPRPCVPLAHAHEGRASSQTASVRYDSERTPARLSASACHSSQPATSGSNSRTTAASSTGQRRCRQGQSVVPSANRREALHTIHAARYLPIEGWPRHRHVASMSRVVASTHTHTHTHTVDPRLDRPGGRMLQRQQGDALDHVGLDADVASQVGEALPANSSPHRPYRRQRTKVE